MIYDTTDLALASTLLCYGFKLEKIEKTNPKRVIFNFIGDITIQQVVDLYFTKQALIEPNYFFSQIKFLKSKIYADNQNS